MPKVIHREMWNEVFESGKYLTRTAKITKLAQMLYSSRDSDDYSKDDAVWEALEKYEDMSGFYMDPTHEQFENFKLSIH